MSKFKVGDKVICVKNTPEVQEGWIGVVFAVEGKESASKYELGAQNETGFYAFHSDELELIKRDAGGIKPQDIQGIHNSKNKADLVNSPKHYSVFEKLEAIEVIASSMTADQFYGYCLGNILKYRLRAGGKDDVMQELGKADRYQGLFTEYKHLCKGPQ